MKRDYIAAVLALLLLGVVSTFALSYVSEDFSETWGAQYTVTYTGASLALDNPDTSFTGSADVTIEFDTAYIETNIDTVKCSFRVIAYKSDGGTGYTEIDGDGTDGKITVSYYDGSTWNALTGGSVSSGTAFDKVIDMSVQADVQGLKVELANDNVRTEYEKIYIEVTDLEDPVTS